MSTESLTTITKSSSATYTDRGSRFYAYAYPAPDPETVESRRSDLLKKYPDATHHCYAWRLDPFQPREFTRDDGEPAGKAGLPILGVIKSENLVNILIIVVRYFGGTKLGKPGLTRAYREAARLALETADKAPLYRFVPFTVTYPYEQESKMRELVNRFRLSTGQQQYLETVTTTVYCKTDDAVELRSILDHLKHVGIQYTSKPECFLPETSN